MLRWGAASALAFAGLALIKVWFWLEFQKNAIMVAPSTAGLTEPTFVLELDRRVHGVSLETPDPSLPFVQRLTTAERAVALVLADGLSNQQIADQLGKSVNAVKFILHRICEKSRGSYTIRYTIPVCRLNH